MKKLLTTLFLLCFVSVQGQTFKEINLNIPREIDSIYGSLVTPDTSSPMPLAIIIAGSGPTDRNGNSMLSNTNSLKFLAESLAKEGIASYRFDKTMIRMLQKKQLKEEDLLFSQLIDDVKTLLAYFKNQPQFSKIYIIGHSQGSLVGMIAAGNQAAGFISLAGAGHPIDEILKTQLSQQVPYLQDSYTKTINLLKSGKKDPDSNPVLAGLFRLSVQGFLINWMQYDPRLEIQKLKIPVLIINGTKDLQVSPEEAKTLQKAKPDATLVLIDNMNHILKEIKGDTTENYASYNQPELPVMPQLVKVIGRFIKEGK